MGGFLRRHKRVIPYLLLAPGPALAGRSSTSCPAFQMFLTSLWSGTLETGYEFALSNVSNYTEALTRFWPQFSRSIAVRRARRRSSRSPISYPLAYTIAFRGGRYKNLLLFLVVAPFFTSFLLRTISWKIILGDTGIVLGPLKDARRAARRRSSSWRRPLAVIAGITYNFLPFMTLPIYVSLEKIDKRLVEAAEDLFATGFGAFRRITLPLSLPGVFAGSLLTFIPAMGDYVNAELLGNPQTTMIGNVIQNQFLTQNNYPTASALQLHPDGRHPHRGRRLRPAARHRRADLGGRLMADCRGRRSTRPRAARERSGSFASGTSYLLFVYTGLAIVYLMAPVVVMALFSFNDPAGKSNFVWQGFSIDAWLNIFGRAGPPGRGHDQPRHRLLVDDRGDDPRHAHRAGPRSPRLPRSEQHQPVHLPADGHARRSSSGRRC